MWFALLFAAGCAGEELAPLPQRTVVFYDYTGAWAATAGNECEDRVDLSDGVFLVVGRAPAGTPDGFYAEYFFMLDPNQPADAPVGRIAADGGLALTIETRGTVGGRRADITYRLRLEPIEFSHVLVTSLTRTVRISSEPDAAARSLDLIREREPSADVPALAAAGGEGLCLRRL